MGIGRCAWRAACAATLLGATAAAPAEGPAAVRSFALAGSVVLGGAAADRPEAMALAPDGTLWIVGSTRSVDFPGAPGSGSTSADALVLRFDPARDQWISVLRFGGSGMDEARAIAFDAEGAAWVVGSTTSPDFPWTVEPAGDPLGAADGFAAKVPADGSSVRAAVRLGGSASDSCAAVVVLDDGTVAVGGTTASVDLPAPSPIPTELRGDSDGFVAILDGDTGLVLRAAYLGGSGADGVAALAAGPAGRLLAAGSTSSTDFPGLMRPWPSWYLQDGYVAVVHRDLVPLGAVRIGGTGADGVTVLVPDDADGAYAGGWTRSVDFPAPGGSPEIASHNTRQPFVVRVDATFSRVVSGRVLGTAGTSPAAGVAIDADGTAWLIAGTDAQDLDVVAPTRPYPSPEGDALVVALDPDGGDLRLATYLGGGFAEEATAVVAAPDGGAWVAGWTESDDFPGAERAPRGDPAAADIFLARFQPRSDGPPLAPAAPEVSQAPGGPARVRWAAPPPGVETVAVYRREEHGRWWEWGFSEVARVPAETLAWDDATVLAARRYSYALQHVADGVGSAASAAAEVDVAPSLRLEPRRGRYSGGLNGGMLRLSGSLFPLPWAASVAADPAGSGMTWSCPDGAGFMSAAFRVPPEDPRWTPTRRGAEWCEEREAGESGWFHHDAYTGRFRMRARWRSGPRNGGDWPIRIEMGDEAGEADTTWVRARRSARLVR